MSKRQIFIGDINNDGKTDFVDDILFDLAVSNKISLSPDEVKATDIFQEGVTKPTQSDYSYFRLIEDAQWFDFNWDDVSGGNNNGN